MTHYQFYYFLVYNVPIQRLCLTLQIFNTLKYGLRVESFFLCGTVDEMSSQQIVMY